MSKSRREWIQCELKLMVGAEPWVMVRHRGGHFAVPIDEAVRTVMQGVTAGWTRERVRRSTVMGRINVPAEQWEDLKRAETALVAAQAREAVLVAELETWRKGRRANP